MRSFIQTIAAIALCTVFSPIAALGHHDGLVRRSKEKQEGLFKRVVVIGPSDHRHKIDLHNNRAESLSFGEAKQSMVSVGVILCPSVGEGEDEGRGGVGTIVVSKEIMITAAHIFYDENNRLFPIEQCYFINAKNPKDRHHVARLQMPPREASHKDFRKDYAIAILSPPVKESIPYELGTEEYAREGERQKLLMISNDVVNHHYMFRPNMQECRQMEQVEPDEAGHKAFLHDCATYPGDSGAPIFIRSAQGGLILKGLHTGQSKVAKENCDYEDIRCSGRAAEISGAFLSDLQKSNQNKKSN